MGTQKGFMGPSVIPFAIMVGMMRKLRPVVFFHECTRTFDHKVFVLLFPGYECHHILTTPADYGMPVRRSRSYTALVKQTYNMHQDVKNIHRLYITPGGLGSKAKSNDLLSFCLGLSNHRRSESLVVSTKAAGPPPGVDAGVFFASPEEQACQC